MKFLSHILRLCVVMLFTVFGANMAFAVLLVTSKITYFQTETTHIVQADGVGFAARTPPLAVTNVTITGGITVMQGSAFALHGQETVAALFDFTTDLNAPNRTGSAVDGIYGNTRPMTEEFPELAGVNPHYVDGAGPGVNTNCVSCVNATVDRLTGRNPSAVAGQSNGYGVPNDLNPSAPWGFREPTSPANVTRELLSEGDGAIAVVRVQQNGPVEHVIVGVNRGGTVHYIDPQLGSVVDLQPGLTVIPGYR